MAVAFDAKMTAGNGVGGTYAEASAATSLSSTGMTVGGSATLLVATIIWGSAPGVTGPAITWNSVAMTLGPSLEVGSGTGVEAAIFYLISPATGNKTLAATWTGSNTCYMSAISFTGTDTLTGIKTADSTTASSVTSITVTSDTNGATVAVEGDIGNSAPTPNFNTIYTASDLTPNSAASYQLGGTSNVHTFGTPNSDIAIVGVHIIAPSSSTGVFEDDSFIQLQPQSFDTIVSIW